MDKALYENYKSVLAYKRVQRERLASELLQLDGLIAGLAADVESYETAERNAIKPLLLIQGVGNSRTLEIPPHLRYAGISVRWALLCLMAEHVTEAIGTTEMAEALKAGGVRSSGANFNANVSAVVSDMARKRAELEAVAEGKYRVTDHGREVWDGIKRNPQYRYRIAGVANIAGDAAKEG